MENSVLHAFFEIIFEMAQTPKKSHSLYYTPVRQSEKENYVK